MRPGTPITRRRFFLLVTAAAMAGATPAFAAFEDEVRRQLLAQGFKQVTITNTLLGRTKIVGTRKGGTREIILNPRTGEILRDLWRRADGSVVVPSIVDSDDDDDDDDDDGNDDGDDDDGGDDDGGDDDGGDDNSGHGGGGDDDGGKGGKGGGDD